MKWWTLLVLLTISNSKSLTAGAFSFNENCKEAYINIISLQFDASQVYLEAEKRNSPDNRIPVVLENYIDFLTVFVSEEKAIFNKLSQRKTERLNLIRQVSENSPYQRWSVAMINLHWAFSRLKFGEYFAAGLELRKAFIMLEENSKQYPDFIQNDIGMGLLQALVGSIPPQYQWLAQLASMHGTVLEGRTKLYQVLAQSIRDPEMQYLKFECLFFLAFIEMNLMPDKSGATHLLSMFDDADSSNLLMVYIRANLQMNNGNNDEAIRTLQNRPGKEQYFPFHYLDYLLADAYLRMLATDSATHYYKLYLDNFKGINFRQDALRKLAWIALIKGDSSQYLHYLDRVHSTVAGQVDADKQALREASQNTFPNKLLLKIRLLFDGGYYQKALAIATENEKNLPIHDQLEYTYRVGRIYHEIGQYNNAIKLYKQTIEIGLLNPAYYAANAALKLGEIYEQTGKPQEALIYYNNSLNMKPDEYRTSIHQKARAGISRIKDK